MNWLKLLMEETSRSEAPDSYFFWSGLSVLSAVVSNRVWIRKKKLYKLYPNIFVFLISKYPGLGKGFPVSVAQKLVTKLGNSRIISGQASIEGIVKELSLTYTTKTGRIINTAEAFLVSGEFGAFLLENPRLFTQLTDLYDSIYHGDKGDTWDKTLASQDKIKLKEVILTGLFAANEVHFNEALPIHAKKGGFLGRVVCVHASKNRKLDAAIRQIAGDDEINYDKLLEHLKKIMILTGEFILEESAIIVYEKWYSHFYSRENVDDTGTSARAKDAILKVCMLLSLSERTDLIITEEHMNESISQTMQSLSSTRTMIIGEGKAEKATEAKTIMGLLSNAVDHKTTRRKLLSDGYGNFDAHDLDRVMETFEQAGLVKSWSAGKDIWYRLTENAIHLLTKFNKEGEK